MPESSPAYARSLERAAEAPAAHGVRTSGMRLALSVHGAGASRRPAVHRRDAAAPFRLARERSADGGPFHAVGAGLGPPVEPRSPEEAADHCGWFAAFASMDAPTSSTRRRALSDGSPRSADRSTTRRGPAPLRREVHRAGYRQPRPTSGDPGQAVQVALSDVWLRGGAALPDRFRCAMCGSPLIGLCVRTTSGRTGSGHGASV